MDLKFNEEAFISDMKNLIKINSINGDCGERTEEFPLGKGVNDAIE